MRVPQLTDVRVIHDSIIEYKVIEEGTQREKKRLVDSRGYSYTKKEEKGGLLEMFRRHLYTRPRDPQPRRQTWSCYSIHFLCEDKEIGPQRTLQTSSTNRRTVLEG